MDNERIDDLMREGLKIIQSDEFFAFGMDAVLLSHFVTVRDGDKIIDLGTGTGVIPLLLSTRAKDVHIAGVEIQRPLAALAQRSVALNGLEDTISIRAGNLRNVAQHYGHGQFDVLTCNPPYMPIKIGPHSPKGPRAIARHELECTLADVIEACKVLVRYKGRAAFVYRAERLVDMITLLRQANFEPKRLRLVQPKADRPANIFLLEAIRGASAGIHWLPTLVAYDQHNQYTQELKQIYYSEGDKANG